MNETMDAIKSAKFQPIPAVRTSKVKQTPNGMQKLYSRIIHKIEDLPPKLHTKLHKPVMRSLPATRSPEKVNKDIQVIGLPSQNVHENIEFKHEFAILSDDDDFYSKLTFDETGQSLEDEIFEELEKVSHDEAKLNAALENFDRILFEYNDKKAKEANIAATTRVMEQKREERPTNIPKPLQKSKTCSIIESKCILKKQEDQKKETDQPAKVQEPLNPEAFVSIPSANCYQVTKSLWNLQDFEEFAKSSSPSQQKTQLGPRKSEGMLGSSGSKSFLPRAKSVWELSNPSSTQRPTYSRQSSISKIPIKSSKLSTSMLQLNISAASSRSNSTLAASHISPSMKLRKTSGTYASTMALSTPSSAPSKLSLVRKSSPPKVIGKYAETKASLQRRQLIASTNSINKLPIAPNKVPLNSSPMKSAKSELSVYCKTALKPNKPVRVPSKGKRDTLLDKCLVKGQELLRKAEEFNDINRVHDTTKTVVDARKRDYIAKAQQQQHQIVTTLTKEPSPIVSMNTKLSSTNSIKNHRTDDDATKIMPKVNAITWNNNQTGNHKIIESEKSVIHQQQQMTTVTTMKIVTVKSPVISTLPSPTLNSSCEMIPVVLDTKRAESCDKVKDYSSDCSDDSGHMSNENEELTLKMDIKKSIKGNGGKISGELLEIFEKKSRNEKISPSKAKVIELNEMNLIKSSMEIYPQLNSMMCRSEVTIMIRKY